jgi:hypothetical protein
MKKDTILYLSKIGCFFKSKLMEGITSCFGSKKDYASHRILVFFTFFFTVAMKTLHTTLFILILLILVGVLGVIGVQH